MKQKMKIIGKNIMVPVAILALMLPHNTLAQWNTSELSQFRLPSAPIFDIILNILDWILAIVGIIGVIGFAIAGILYLTAAGDDDRMKSAKNAMTYSIIGVIVALAGLVAITAADNLLNAQIF